MSTGRLDSGAWRLFADEGRRFSQYEKLMPHRVRDILLVASLYDSFILAEDGQLNELILDRYVDLNLRYAPRVRRVSTGAEALAAMDLRIPFVGPDNREGAYRVGLALAETLEPGAEVAIIGGIPSAFNARERAAGFRDAMAEAGMTVVTEQAADWEQAKAATVAAAILNENPALSALLCANDSMALGAVAAVRQAGRRGEVTVVGFDNISAARDLIAGGDMLATAEQYGDQLAVFGIEYALQVLEASAAPEDRKTPVDVITAEDL